MTGAATLPAPAAFRRGRRPPRALRTRFFVPKDDYAPIAQINTTPLVDVMLVLLIMFIMIIPVAQHKVALDLPPPSPDVRQPPPVHRLDIAANGALYWDGSPLAAAALAPRLAAFASDPAHPMLALNADGEARYERVDQILAQVRRAGVTRLGFVDNARFLPAIAR